MGIKCVHTLKLVKSKAYVSFKWLNEENKYILEGAFRAWQTKE
jgi:3-mercaptopyruvate sulfurtransferase SseA